MQHDLWQMLPVHNQHVFRRPSSLWRTFVLLFCLDPAEQKDTRSHDDDASDKGSVASGASAATSVVDHDVDMASSAAEADEAELVVDWRRAKRLKKLKRMMTCTAAQSATDRLRLHTWCLVGGILVIHIVCFIIAVMQISDKYE